MQMTVDLVTTCEQLVSLEVYQNWVWMMASAAKRRGGCVLHAGDVQAGVRYRALAKKLVAFFAGPGRELVCCAGERRVTRFASAVENTEFLDTLATRSRQGRDLFLGEEEALNFLELRRATQPVVDWVMSEVRMQQELFEKGKGEKSDEKVRVQ